MIHVDRSRVSLSPELHTRAQVAYQKIAAGFANDGVLIFDDSVWRSMRASLMELFQNKCAYCDTPIEPLNIGRIEHFRPKGAVRDESNRIVYLDAAGLRAHPGYYWLAFDPTNLLPSCTRCNRLAYGGGKSERFPVEGFRATRPGEQQLESPLLLHPGFDRVETHFKIDRTGVLGHTTRRAETCIEIFKLNADKLIKKRRRAYNEVITQVKSAMSEYMRRGDEFQDAVDRLQEDRDGTAEYSLAGRQALQDCKAAWQSLVQTLDSLFG